MTTVFEGKAGSKTIFTVDKRDDGYLVVERPSKFVVSVIAITDNEELILVSQFRPGVNEVVIELPAGLDDTEGESLAEVAERELLEETGYTAKKFTEVVRYPKSPGLVNEIEVIFFAEGLEKVAKGGGLEEEGENINVHLVPPAKDDAPDNVTINKYLKEYFEDKFPNALISGSISIALAHYFGV